MKNNRIILKSKKLNKEILPRLSTAHNYGLLKTLPVYKFLCNMQVQDVNMTAVYFNWGSFSKAFKFLPRAEYEDVVLSPATWNLAKGDYDILLKNINSNNFMVEATNWRQKLKMPRHVMFREGDNEFFIDLESELSIKTFLDVIKKKNEIELVEFLFDNDSALVRDQSGKPFTNEIVAVLFNNDYKRKPKGDIPVKNVSWNKIMDRSSKMNTNRVFSLGSEWLSYKIYCGVKSADKILVKSINPLVDELTRKGLTERWFFIRYHDPDFHIRLRFFNHNTNKLGEIVKIVHKYLSPFQESGIISKIINDTYIRELERYSNNAIELTEEYFAIESEMILQLLSNTASEMPEDIKLFYALRSIDDLLEILNFTPGQKLGYMKFLKNIFINEHGGYKELKLKLDDKFRGLKINIENILNKKKDKELEFISVVNLLNWRKQKLISITQKILNLHEKRQLEIGLNNLLSSYLHMNMNRIFSGQQRTYEMVIYDILYRFYKSKIAREGKRKKTANLEMVIAK